MSSPATKADLHPKLLLAGLLAMSLLLPTACAPANSARRGIQVRGRRPRPSPPPPVSMPSPPRAPLPWRHPPDPPTAPPSPAAPLVRVPGAFRLGPHAAAGGGSAAPLGSATAVRHRFHTTYRDLARARIRALRAVRSLAPFARRARHRAQATRALRTFRRALQGAFRLAYAARARCHHRLRRLTPAQVPAAAAALTRTGHVVVSETVTGPAAGAFDQVRDGLLGVARSGAAIIHAAIALWAGPVERLLRALSSRFTHLAGRAASALDDLARALR